VSDADLPPASGPDSRAGSGIATAAALVAVLLLAIVIGVISSLYATQLVRFGPIHISVGAVIAGGFDLLGGLLAAYLLELKDAALVPGLGWFLGLAVLVFVPTGGGDVLVPGSGDDVYAFLAAGVSGTVLAGALSYWPGRLPALVLRRTTPGA
jgi:hypothetical protein